MLYTKLQNAAIMAALNDVVTTTIHGVAGDDISDKIQDQGLSSVKDIVWSRLQDHFTQM